MRGKLLFSMTAVPCAIAMLASAATAAEPSTVKNKAYDVWVSQSFAPLPYTPFHDCFRFPVNQVCSDSCGDCGALTETRIGTLGLTLWTGTIPCGGLNLQIVGTSLDGNLLSGGLGADVLGGSIAGISQNTTFGVEGVANPTCSVTADSVQKLIPYNKRSGN